MKIIFIISAMLLAIPCHAYLVGWTGFVGTIDGFNGTTVKMIDGKGQAWSISKTRFPKVDIRPGKLIRVWVRAEDLKKVQRL